MEEKKTNYFSRITKALLIVFPLLLLLALLQTTVTVSAYEYASGTCGNDLTWVLDSDGTLTISGEGKMVFSNYTEAPWYEYRNSIISVVIDPGTQNIAAYAFHNCSELTDVSIPDSVTSIGAEAFYGCKLLYGIFIPESMTYIERDAFRGCCNLEWIVVDLDNTVFDSRENCNALIETETNTLIVGCNRSSIPYGVTDIGSYAFYYCAGLINITIPDSVTSISNYAFYGCTGLISISIPDSVTKIGSSAFSGCKSLTSIMIPDSVISIDDYAFNGCTGLVTVTISNSVTSIGNRAFYGCKLLDGVFIPESVTYIGKDAFRGCSNLEWIVVDPNNTVYDSRENCNALIETETNTLIAGCNESSIPYGVTGIGSSAFYDCGGLTGITIPDSVTNIGKQAFCRCTGLTSITIPDSVTKIADQAFWECMELTSITLSDGLISIGIGAFSDCMKLTSIIIPDSVISIGSYAFYGCDRMTTVTIFGSVTNIDVGTFSVCLSLTNISIPDSVTIIDEDAFFWCESLRSITVPDSVTSIGGSAFCDCTGLTNIVIPASVETIGSMAFEGCTNLTDVFYDGTEEEWNRLSKDAGIGNIHLFSQENHDAELDPDIQIKDVPGGKTVTIGATGGSVFYTLDGTHPGTASIPYEGIFLLDEAGDYMVSAIAIDNSTGSYGYAVTDSFKLERSGLPQIHEENGWIHITPEEDVYYSLDLTEEPTAASSRYKEPLLISNAMTIRARIIESGKAPGQTVSYYYSVNASSFQYPADSYQFSNTASSFGYPTLGYKISKERYTEIFGTAAGEFLYDIYGGTLWAGSCYGMSATSLMFSKGILNLDLYSDEAQSLYNLKSLPDVLIRLIERYQVAQFLPEMMKERDDKSSGGTMVISGLSSAEEAEEILSTVKTSFISGNPVILILWRNDLMGSHAVVPYRMENGKIYIYDCNDPGGENAVTYQMNNNGTYSFNYGQYSYAVSINTLTTLLQRLEGLQTGQVSLTADGKEQMLVSLNANSFRIMDPYGNEVTDYTVCRTTEDMLGTKTVLYLERGDYTIVNTDMSASSLQISVSTEEEYYSVAVDDPQAIIGIGTEYGHLYITVSASDAAQIHVHTMNTSGRENVIDVTADYAKIYACTERAVLVETTAPVMTANGETKELTESLADPAMYFGSIAQRYIETARPGYDDITGCRLSTETTELPGTAFSLGVQVSGAEDAVIYVATYDTDGRMLEIRSRRTEAGRTRYPFTISGEAAKVQVFLVDQETGVPLTGSLTIQ